VSTEAYNEKGAVDPPYRNVIVLWPGVEAKPDRFLSWDNEGEAGSRKPTAWVAGDEVSVLVEFPAKNAQGSFTHTDIDWLGSGRYFDFVEEPVCSVAIQIDDYRFICGDIAGDRNAVGTSPTEAEITAVTRVLTESLKLQTKTIRAKRNCSQFVTEGSTGFAVVEMTSRPVCIYAYGYGGVEIEPPELRICGFYPRGHLDGSMGRPKAEAADFVVVEGSAEGGASGEACDG